MQNNNLLIILITFLLLSLILPANLSAQYFGRNKVQYEDFNFKVLHTDHFDIYHYPKEQKAVKDLGRLSERWYRRHSTILDHTFKSPNPLIIYANHADFQQNDIIPNIGIGTGGVTEGLRNRVIMPFAQANHSTNHVLGHELVHAFQYDIARDDKIGGIRATSKLPLWFIEGMAEYLSTGPRSTHTAMWLRDAVQNDDVPSIKDLSNTRKYFPYRYGHSLWSFIAGEWGDDKIIDLYVLSAQKGINKGFKNTLGISTDSVSTLWNEAIKEKYSEDITHTVPPEEVGELILGKSKGTGSLNVAPALSPDGEKVAFISEKGLFSLELFLADAETGEIIRKLTTTNRDPHLNALRFIESSGSWSPDGSKIAAVVFAKGDNQMAIINTRKGGIIRQLDFGEVDALSNPAWSPDGDKIAFSGSDGGYSDLYIYDLKTDSLMNVTDDPYSDLQPVWSPSGSKIAFVTDRGAGTSFENLTFGKMKIRILDLQSGEINEIPEFYKSKHINPQFGQDGNSLYYISDYQGFSNVYRYSFSTNKRYQVTNVSSGISGISEYSPALTVAAQSGDMLVTVFNKGNYSIYRIPEAGIQGEELLTVERMENSGLLPSAGGGGNLQVVSYLENPDTDLPAEGTFKINDYTPKLSLTTVTGGGGVGINSQLGVGAAGGVVFQFSDILNQHILSTSLRLQGSFKDISGQLAYLNRDNRFIWGLSASHQTFRTQSTFLTENDTTTIDGQQVVAPLSINQINQRIFRERISAIGIYPFSTTQRMEFSTGYSHIWYDFELIKTFVSSTGVPVERDRIDFDQAEPSPVNLYSASTAYVEDNSLSAFTGPIQGHRLRLEVEPTTGSLTFLNVLTDYRRYFYMQPFTLAFRALHTGRYLKDSDSGRLSPNFLGFESLIRGYNTASFEPSECSQVADNQCPEFNRLIGSRIGVANVELRLPFLGAEQISLFRTRILPTTLTAFFDGGVAWTQDDPPEIKWETESTDRIPVFSAGLSARFNFFGYLVGELYYAVPFQRPEQGGYFGFHIAPGW